MSKKNAKISLITLISFNTMSVFSFDSIHGFIQSLNPISRQKKISEILKSESPDVITLQEVHTYFVLNILRKKLNYPFVVYEKYIYGPKGGLVTFSKFPVEGYEYVGFKKRGSIYNSSFIAHVIRNGILVTKLKDFPLVILNAHATPNLDHDDSKNNRFIKYIDAQLDQISGLVRGMIAEKENVILAGDLNVAKNSYSYDQFVHKSGLDDVFSDIDSPTQHQEYLQKSKKVRRIDYIFSKAVGSKSKIENKTHVFSEKYVLENGRKCYLSDHIGLKASISF
jgi:endonuclease/exonuclease/phosphatase family metal-dependent hydrolase